MYSGVRMLTVLNIRKAVISITTQVSENGNLPLQIYQIAMVRTLILWCVMGNRSHQPNKIDNDKKYVATMKYGEMQSGENKAF
jgi:hypothetical protein